MTHPLTPPSLDERLAAAERARMRDRGHFNQYGLRIDSRPDEADRANPGTGAHARRYGAGGDLSTYANRAHGVQTQQLPDEASSDAPASRAAP